MKYFASFALVAFCGISTAQTVNSGTLSTFTTLAGAKLDAPSTYLKAIDFTNVNRTNTVQGITFTSSDFTPNFSPQGANFAASSLPLNYGPGADAGAFATIMQDIRWGNTGLGQGTVGGTFTGMTPGQYLVKMYFFENFYGTSSAVQRKFNIQLDNTLVVTGFVPGGLGANVSYVYELPVTIGLQTGFTVRAINGTYPGFDNNPILSAMTLQAVPEPATMAILGLGTVGLLRRRKAKQVS